MIGQSPTTNDADGLPPTPEDVAVAALDIESAVVTTPATAGGAQREIGGRDGPEPTRYGDWEKNGRCIDF